MGEDGLYDTPRAALEALTDYPVLERLAVAVLQRRGYPGLVLTESVGDLGRDGYVRAPEGDHDETVLLVSARKRWAVKLDEDLNPQLSIDEARRLGTAIFVTSRTVTEVVLKPRRERAGAAGVVLDVWGQARLALELEKDDLRSLAERELGVRPMRPGALQTVATFRDRHGRAVPGFDAALVGPGDEMETLRSLLDTGTTLGRAAVVLVTGPAGVGKTRLAVDAAHECAATVVAPTSVPLDPGELARVPVDEPAVLVVDDAHRSPDLSGLPSLLGTARFDRVAVVHTARPGLEQAVLGPLGIDPDHVHRVLLRLLDDRGVDRIVHDHGIADEPFRRHVIEASGGIPLMAHIACMRATQRGSYGSRTTADILRRFVQRRLEFLDSPPNQGLDDQRRAAAVAVAALAGARRSDRVALAGLAPAITSLPPAADRLDRALNDLLEAGLIDHPDVPDYPVVADGPELGDYEAPDEFSAPIDSDDDRDPPTRREIGTHVVRPDAAGPVLLADALADAQRIRLDLAALLPLLGRHATIPGIRTEATEITNVLGIPRPEPGDAHLPIQIGELATQLGSLANAINLVRHEPGRALLRRAIVELIETPPGSQALTVDAWADVVTLAGQAAAAAPDLVSDVHRTLIRRWPLPASTWLWPGDDPADSYRNRMDTLVRTVVDQVRHLEHHGSALLMPWVLDLAWLSYPVLGSAVRESVLQAAKALGSTRTTRGVDTVEAVLARRAALREAVEQWVEARLDQPDDGLAPPEHGVRTPSTVLLLACAALEPLASLRTEEIARVPGEPMTFTLTQPLLPDVPATAAELGSTLDTVTALLDRLLDRLPVAHLTAIAGTDIAAADSDLDPEALSVLRWIVERPRELLAEGARGFGGSDGPLPEYALSLLEMASDRTTALVAARWARLPLVARHAAARATVRRANIGRRRTPNVQRTRTLAGVAERGDPVATLAAAHPDLAPVLALCPVDDDILDEIVGRAPATIPLSQRADEAAVLGASIGLPEVLRLLDVTSRIEPSVHERFVAQFANAAGETLVDLEPLLAHLERAGPRRGRRLGEECLFRGALVDHAEPLSEWLLARVDRQHHELVELGLAVVEDLPAAVATALIDQVVDLITTDTKCDDGADERRRLRQEFATAASCARSLTRPIGPTGARLARLCSLGLAAPDSALPRVIASIAHVLDDVEHVLPEGAPSPAQLTAVVRRCLDVVDAQGIRSDQDQYTTAFGIVALLSAVPSEMALLFYTRACTRPDRPIPRPWRESIAERAAFGSYAAAANAFAAADIELGGSSAASEVDFAIRRLLDLLSGETSGKA